MHTPNGTEYNRVIMYDIKQKSWSVLPSFITGRRAHVSFILSDVLYVLGGVDPDHEGTPLLNMECLNLSKTTPEWEVCDSNMSVGLSHSASCIMNGSVYISGGIDHEQKWFSKSLYRWHPGKVFEKLSSMKFGRADHGMVTDGERLYCIGARFEHAAFTEMYDPNQEKWFSLKALPHEKMHTSVVYVPPELLVVPGGQGSSETDAGWKTRSSVYVYNISSDIWAVSNVTLNMAVRDSCVVVIPDN